MDACRDEDTARKSAGPLAGSQWKLDRRQFVIGSAAALAACGGGGSGAPNTSTGPTNPPPVAAGNRVLGIAPTEREASDFNPVADLLISSGARNATLSLYWDDIETAPGVFAPNPNNAAIANSFYDFRGLPITVSLSGIDTNQDRRPADLAALAYDDPQVIARYKALASWVMGQLADVSITAFSICNEIDATLGADQAAWQQYRAFFASVAPHLRSLRQGLVVGSKATFGVVTDAVARSEYQALLADADAAMITYYPLANDFTVEPLSAIASDFAAMAAAAQGKPVRVLECGYPTASLLGSSETRQADFITAVFQAWDAHEAQIPQIDFFALHDFSPALVQNLVSYYGIGGANFAAFLGTLGLRTWPGEGAAKEGWTRFVAEAAARGFS